MRSRILTALLAAATVVVAGCGAPDASPSPSSKPPVASSPAPVASSLTAPTPDRTATPGPPPSIEPEVTPAPVGFAFAADDVLAYYEVVGYACSTARPSTQAAGYTARTCESTDAAGRTLVVGVVTDASGALGNGFASLSAADGEDVLEPLDAFDPLAGFLGAMLGAERGAPQVEWLAAHIGDSFAEISDGGLRIATYTPSEDDHSAIHVELANQAYLDAPRPSGG